MPRGIYRHMPPEERFWSKVEITPSCWNWKSGKRLGYGLFKLNDKLVQAHRFAYELFNGKIPKNGEIDHLCRNRGCVNPDHMEVVSHRENTRRGLAGWNMAIKTHCPQGHEYSEENTGIRTNGSRYCRTCTREYHRELVLKNK